MPFRVADPSDLPVLLSMQEVFYRCEGYPFEKKTAERPMRQLAGNLGLGRLFVVEMDGLIVGYMAITFGFSLEFGGRDAFVDELYLTPEARGRGLGGEALLVAEEACREVGITALHLEVEHDNEKAIAVYSRAGFVEHQRHLMTKRFL